MGSSRHEKDNICDLKMNLSASEMEALKEIKNRLDGELTPYLRDDDSLYLRFLRARDFKINLAEDMLRKHILWRKTNGVDTIFEDFVPNKVTVEYLPLSRIGFDKTGAPVRYFHFGPTDSKGILKSARKNDVIKTLISYFEDDVRVMKEQSKKLGKPVERWTYILDFDTYTFAQATHKPSLEFLLNIFQVYEANYPERLKAALIINTSIYFNLLYSIIKPLLSGATVQKVSIYGKDGFKNDLLKFIDDDVLPIYLGGTRTDSGDPMCSNTIKLAKPVPEELYLIKSKISISSQPDAKKLVVSRKSKVQLQVYVDQPESVIEWEFETETRDIGFGLIYKNDRSESSKAEELVPKQRVDAHLVSEAGMYKCHKSGIYVLVFDNSYSWIHRKEIYCKVSVVSPVGKVIPCTAL